MCEFEKKVFENLKACNINEKGRLGLAVSGGADSVSLLVAFSKIISELREPGQRQSFALYVITVNHNIRPAEESAGDAVFVKNLCKKLQEQCGFSIPCKVVELEPGAVSAEAEKRGAGIEDAARSLRYQAFEEFCTEYQLDALCLAHNKNDQLETLLMRFLQGSPAEAAAGIRSQRGHFVRPLLNIERSEIEEYLKSQNISWRTDKTNFETEYLRNKIRHKLIPFLNEEFTGWQKAVLSGAEKAAADAAFIQTSLEAFKLSLSEDGSVNIPLDDFLKAPEAIKYRLLLEACNKAGEKSRIPHSFLKDVLLALELSMSNDNQNASFSKHFLTIDIIKEKNKLFVKKHSESNTDLVFSDIIEESGTYEFPFGDLCVYNYREQNGKGYVDVKAGKSSPAENIPLPFCVRSFQPGDTVIAADASEKKVSDIYSDWHVPPEKRSLVPVIQILDENPQRIVALLGGFSGYKDWIVKL